MAGMRPPKPCGLYLPGHHVHFIQARRAWEDTEHPPETANLIELRDDGGLVVHVGTEVRHLWNHQPERVGDAVGVGDRTIFHQPRWGLLIVGRGPGQHLFCVAGSDVDHRECPTVPPTGSPAALLLGAGGFFTPAADLRALTSLGRRPIR
jgi:hypothetical protein